LTLTFSDVSAFKNEVQNQFGVNVHFHDGCGGQYFSLDEFNEEINSYISQYFSNLNLQADFSSNGLQFTVSKI
jgi:hypothetical protein